MGRSIHARRDLVALSLACAGSILLGMDALAAVERLTHFETPYAEVVFLLVLGVISLTAFAETFTMLTERIGVTDEALTVHTMFGTRETILWEDVREVGVGQVFWMGGIRHCAYFARCELTAEEVDNLDLATHKCVYLNRLSASDFETISRHCPDLELSVVRRLTHP